MKKICYIILYFGKLPENFQLWLYSCKYNATVDFLLFTDDRTEYDYPSNVKVKYTSFEDISKKFQGHFDFTICLKRPYKLCDFRPAFGELFADELVGYDFWGYCDIDVVFGDIRHFYNDGILECYERVGFQGHSTIYKNTPEANARYKTENEGRYYKEVFSNDRGFAFDELGMDEIYSRLGIAYYRKTVFAHLTKFDCNFYLALLPQSEAYKNKSQIFTWSKGHLTRHYISDGEVCEEEYMYLHYWLRPTSFRLRGLSSESQVIIYPDVTTVYDGEITQALIRKKSRQNKIVFYLKYIWRYRKKLTPKRIVHNIMGIFANKKNR